MARPRFVLFDWDNTLVDTWPVIQECYNAVFDAFQQPRWSRAEVMARAHGSLRDNFPRLFGADAGRAQKIFYDRFHAIHLERLTPLPGASDLLLHLRTASIGTAVVSNKVGDNLRTEARHLGWDGFFHRIIGATDAARDKPAPDPIHLALQDSGVESGPDVWMVGDTTADLLAARAAGCLPVLIRQEPAGPDEFAACPPAIQARDCHALLALMLE